MKEEEIWEEINEAYEKMTIPRRKLCDIIRIDPEMWNQHPYGNRGNGFWVVAIYGRQVVWYNDIGNGFNRSMYSKYRELDKYYCNQNGVQELIQYIINEIKHGYSDGMYCGPTEPIK